jgi:hypothetical protein
VSLQLRRRRVEAELAAGRREPSPAIGGISGGGRDRLARVLPAPILRLRAAQALTRTLDDASRAPAGQVLRSGDRAAPLAGLAGISPAEYLRRSPGEQRAARVEIERELARRRELLRERALPLRGSARAAPKRAAGSGREGPAQEGPQAPSPIARRARQFGSWLR